MCVGVLFVVEVVQQAGEIPEQRVFVILHRVAFQRGRDHQGVVPLIFIPDMLMKESEGGVFRREHGGRVNHEDTKGSKGFWRARPVGRVSG